MRPELAAKLRELVAGGATIVGRKPLRSPSLARFPEADRELESIATDLWGDLDGVSRTIRYFGKGRVVWGRAPGEVLAQLNVGKDFEYARGLDAEVVWLHRRTPAAEIYYVVNHTDQPREFEARFRVAGKEAELWRPETGRIEAAGYRIDGERTTVPLRLAEREAVFVVFRKAAVKPERAVAPPTPSTVIATLDDDWTVRFPAGAGAPAEVRLAHLAPWSTQAEEGVKYFSGTGTYTKRVAVGPEAFQAGTGVFFGLGRVGDIAEVAVNGRNLGTHWHAPYEVDVTGALQPGDNVIEIKVTNQWTNRLIGDRAVAPERRVLGEASTPGPGPHRVDPPLPESGLIGPVRLVTRPVNRVADTADGNVAGIPANYTEALAGDLPVPDPLRLSGGGPVRDARTWNEQRRPELLRLFAAQQFGRVPEGAGELSWEVTEAGTPVFGGKALRRQVTLYFTRDKAGPHADVLIYLPAGQTKPVPLLLNVNFTANNLAVDDPGVKIGRVWDPKQKQRIPATEGRRFGRLNVLATVERGFGLATVNYGDFEPDTAGAIAFGVRQAFLPAGQAEPAADEWGTISAWSWGLSRVLDYLETDAQVDAKRVALLGVSRLGKTVLWTGARDPRFALIIASCSGEGGAAISRRNYGETVAHLTAPTRYPYQFAANYGHWAGRAAESPVDGNLLVSLIAPRPLLLQTGDTDIWSDPKGEFLAARSATPVYALLGKTGLATDQMPQAGQRIGGTLGYYMHEGGHGTVPSDWEVFLRFMQENL